MAKILYKPVSIVAGILAGMIASTAFEKLWERIGSGEPADPDQLDVEWWEVIGSAILSGAVYAVVRAVVQRAGAKGFERATGVWPGTVPGDKD